MKAYTSGLEWWYSVLQVVNLRSTPIADTRAKHPPRLAVEVRGEDLWFLPVGRTELPVCLR